MEISHERPRINSTSSSASSSESSNQSQSSPDLPKGVEVSDDETKSNSDNKISSTNTEPADEDNSVEQIISDENDETAPENISTACDSEVTTTKEVHDES